MADSRDFDAFCHAELMPALRGLEVRRKKAVLCLKIAIGLLVFVPLLLLLQLALGLSLPHFWLYGLIGLAALVCGGLYYYHKEVLSDAFKRHIMSAIVRHRGSDFRYSPKRHIPRERFKEGRIFTTRIDRYRGEDHVAGRIGSTEFEFSELHVEERSKHDDRDDSGDERNTIFQGIYFVADFNKTFATRTVVLPDVLESVFGVLAQALQSMNLTRGELIKLEDPEFEKAFAVYGDDQVEARYILTPALMRRMLKVRAKAGGLVYFSFVNSQVHVAISSSKNHFEPSVFSSLLNMDAIREHYRDLVEITGIIEDLNLNTRIWTKE